MTTDGRHLTSGVDVVVMRTTTAPEVDDQHVVAANEGFWWTKELIFFNFSQKLSGDCRSSRKNKRYFYVKLWKLGCQQKTNGVKP
jgi:hypothetical protein